MNSSEEKTPTVRLREAVVIVKNMGREFRRNRRLGQIDEYSAASFGEEVGNSNSIRPASVMAEHVTAPTPTNRIMRSASLRAGGSGRIRTNSAMNALVRDVSAMHRRSSLEPGCQSTSGLPMFGPAGSGLSASGLAMTDDYGNARSAPKLTMRNDYGIAQSAAVFRTDDVFSPSVYGYSPSGQSGSSLSAPGLAFASPVKSSSTAFRLSSPDKKDRRSTSRRRSASERRPSVIAAMSSSEED